MNTLIYPLFVVLIAAWFFQAMQISELQRQNDYLRAAIGAADEALDKANTSLAGSNDAMLAAGNALELCRKINAGEWIDPPATSPVITWRGRVATDVADSIRGVDRESR